MPYFSIVIPVFNKERFVAATLKSALAQSFADFEIIVVNDGSTDDSEKAILGIQDDRIRYFSKQNEGVVVARNFGIEKATADFICFLDADDYWYPNFLEVMHSYVDDMMPTQLVYASAIEIETKNRRFRANYSMIPNYDFEIVDFFAASQKECAMWTSSVCIHKSVFEKVGVFDPNIKYGEDTELWIRIGLQFKIFFIWDVLARYVYDQDSVSRKWFYFFEPYTFEKYANEEKKNPALKQYMDLNRFSAVIKCKLHGDSKTAKEIYANIDLENLSPKKQLLLKLPPLLLKGLIGVQKILGKSVFR